MAYDAANGYLAELRQSRAPGRPSAPPPPSKMLHLLENYRHFETLEEAVEDVTVAVFRLDGVCMPGREQSAEFVQVSRGAQGGGGEVLSQCSLFSGKGGEFF